MGSDALVRLPVDEVRDPHDPNSILERAIPSGVQALCNALRDAFGSSDQEMVSRAIEDFFEFRRGKMTFQEYSIEWDIRLEEATTRAGLDLNEVGKFYLFFKNANLTTKFVDDIKLQLQGDLRRFQEARSLALRLITRKDGKTLRNLRVKIGAMTSGPKMDGTGWTARTTIGPRTMTLDGSLLEASMNYGMKMKVGQKTATSTTTTTQTTTERPMKPMSPARTALLPRVPRPWALKASL